MRIKYMGTSDIHRLEKGENFGGQLSKEAALDRDIEWNWENNHIIDTDEEPYKDLSADVLSLLLDPSITHGEFRDVTDLKRVPTNGAQQMWRGAKKTEEALPSEAVSDDDKADDDKTEPEPIGDANPVPDTSSSSGPLGAVAKKSRSAT